MDDMTGVPEREDAQVISINSHPNFRGHNPCLDIQIGSDDQQGDGVDEEMIAILEEAGASQALEERNAVGNNVCYQCVHRKDDRPWWKRWFGIPDIGSFMCTASTRTEVADPVTGEVQYIQRIQGPMGTSLALVNKPHISCYERNPDGKCQRFDIAIAKKKKHRKGRGFRLSF